MVSINLVKMEEGILTPSYAHENDAGIDIRSAQDTFIRPGETSLVRTGIKISIPEGYVALIWDKSGHAAKNSITTMAGVIDSGYRGEIKIVLKNLGTEDFEITKNMKIAQMLIQSVEKATINVIDSLDETSRSKGGFGSTGSH